MCSLPISLNKYVTTKNVVMKEMLLSYLGAVNGAVYDYIEIDFFEVKGSRCYVEFWTDEHHNYRILDQVNVWEVMVWVHGMASRSLPSTIPSSPSSPS